MCCNSSGKQSIQLNSVLLGGMKPVAFNLVRKRVVFLSHWLFVVWHVCVCLFYEVFVLSDFNEKFYSSAVVP